MRLWKVRGFLSRIPVGSSLLTGAGLFLIVTGLLVPSLIFYWNRPPMGLRKEKGFWTCFLIPTLIVLDAIITYASINSYGPPIETVTVSK